MIKTSSILIPSWNRQELNVAILSLVTKKLGIRSSFPPLTYLHNKSSDVGIVFSFLVATVLIGQGQRNVLPVESSLLRLRPSDHVNIAYCRCKLQAPLLLNRVIQNPSAHWRYHQGHWLVLSHSLSLDVHTQMGSKKNITGWILFHSEGVVQRVDT